MSESRRKNLPGSGPKPESTMIGLVASGVTVVMVLLAVAAVALVARALAPDAGSLARSPLAGFLGGVATAVAVGVRLLERQVASDDPITRDLLANLRSSLARSADDALDNVGPPVVALLAFAGVMNWWEPSQAVAGVAVAGAAGAVIALILGAGAAALVRRRPLWLPSMATPAWLQLLRSNVSASVVVGGLLVLATTPVVGSTFGRPPLDPAAVGQIWAGVFISALVCGLVALRVGKDRALALRLSGLRMLAGLAGAGVGVRLGSGDPQLVVAVVAVAGLVALLSDTEAVWAFDERLASPQGQRSHTALSYAATLAKLAVVAVGLVFGGFGGPGDAAGNGGLAVAVALVVAFEFLSVDLILRPLIVEQGPTFHRLVRPWRAAWHGYTVSSNRVATSPPASPGGTSGAQQVIEELVRQEFRLLSGQPTETDVTGVFVSGVPAGEQAVGYRAKLAEAGLHIEGGEPQVQQVTDLRGRNPLRARIVVEYPAQRLVDGSGRLCGRRSATRRWGMVWLVPNSTIGYRVAEAVSQGSEPLHPLDMTTEPPSASRKQQPGSVKSSPQIGEPSE